MENLPTPREVADALKAAHGLTKDEELRAVVGPTGFRTFQRWLASGWPKPARDAMRLLVEAGYVEAEPSLPAARRHRAKRVADRLLEDVRELNELL